MKKVKLIKPKIKDSKALNNPVNLYAYTREGGSTNYGCDKPSPNPLSICKNLLK